MAEHTVTGLRDALHALALDIADEAVTRGLTRPVVYRTRPGGADNPALDAPCMYYVLGESSNQTGEWGGQDERLVFVLRIVVEIGDLQDSEPELDAYCDVARDLIDTRIKTRAGIGDDGPLAGTCRVATRTGMREELLELGGVTYLLRAFPIVCEQRRRLAP